MFLIFRKKIKKFIYLLDLLDYLPVKESGNTYMFGIIIYKGQFEQQYTFSETTKALKSSLFKKLSIFPIITSVLKSVLKK